MASLVTNAKAGSRSQVFLPESFSLYSHTEQGVYSDLHCTPQFSTYNSCGGDCGILVKAVVACQFHLHIPPLYSTQYRLCAHFMQ